ncbi:MAG: hypothetical protein OHK0024_10760 [Thalassobaculales bacterium]
MTLAGALATLGPVGHLPRAPGTWGSAAMLPAAWLLQEPLLILAAALAVAVLGTWAAGAHARALGAGDPGSIVIDEAAGQLLALAACPPDPLWYAAALALFRLFDIWKPGPVGWCDRRLSGGWGIMADDLAAGGLAGLILLAAQAMLAA